MLFLTRSMGIVLILMEVGVASLLAYQVDKMLTVILLSLVLAGIINHALVRHLEKQSLIKMAEEIRAIVRSKDNTHYDN